MKEYKLDFNTFMGGWFMPENVVDSVLNWGCLDMRHYSLITIPSMCVYPNFIAACTL